MKRIALQAGVVSVLTGALALSGCAGGYDQASRAGTYEGPPTAVGEGEARSFVTLDAQGEPIALGVRLSPAALTGLPSDVGHAGPAVEYRLDLPPEAAATGYDHVTVDWNPHGHFPPGVYDVAHFDFHFYLIDDEARNRITGEGEDRARASKAPATEFMPAGYVLPEGTDEPRMGAHAIHPGAPEFNQQPFTKTFIYGFYDGEMVFVEPMVTKAFLETRADVREAIPLPERYHRTAYYPTEYRVGYDAETEAHVVVLEGLVRH
ncbi:DUF5602 domain-containing protein [Ectothiorhodospiraceae bacterium 2226]|nr:DUF5602 domain-containing protein [Ectothiorhodospiraceae bacterium 2226]